MKLKRTYPGEPLYADIERLMEEAFPPEERRPVDKQRRKALGEETFHVYALTVEDRFVGLLTCWMLPGFVYVEHLATLPAERGRGLGRQALRALFGLVALPVVLEVELPVDELTGRRVEFYRRNGFVLWENSEYLQPPYRPGDVPFPLKLMVHGTLEETTDFESVRKMIHIHVYEQAEALRE